MQGNGRPPYVSLVPLHEILAEVFEVGDQTKKVQDQYWALVNIFGTEFNVLLKAGIEEIKKVAAPRVAEGIEKVRSGKIIVEPGYDGKFGVVSIWNNKEVEIKEKTAEAGDDQLSIFA